MIFAPIDETITIAPAAPAPAVEWLWVSSRFATFGVGLADGVVVETAECAAWLLGATEDEARAELREDDANVQIVSLSEAAA